MRGGFIKLDFTNERGGIIYWEQGMEGIGMGEEQVMGLDIVAYI